MSNYFIGQAAIYLGQRDTNGNPVALKWAGDCSEAKYSMTPEKREKKENWSGLMSVAASTIIGRTAKLTLKADEMTTLDNLKRAVHGGDASQTTGTVTGESISAAQAVVGALVPLAKQNVSSLVIVDSTAGTPVTLVAGTHYRAKPKHGSIEIISVEGLTFPLIAGYSFGATKTVGLASEDQPDWYCRVEGVNLSTKESIVAAFYRMQIDPAAEISFIGGGDYGSYTLECTVLIDPTKPADDDLGQFGFISVI